MSNEPPYREKLSEATFLIRHGRSADAISILNAIIEFDPDCAWALEERGRAKMFTGDHGGSIADFSRMIAWWPENPKGYTCRADARGRAGNPEGAIEDYSSAITIDPKHPFAFLQRGRLRAGLGDYAGAILDFTFHMNVCPRGRLSGLLNRGRTKLLASDVLGAISDLTEAIGLEGERPIYGPLFRGRAKLAAEDFSGAIADFSAAIAAFPGLTNAYRHRAEARTLVGDTSGATADRARYDQLGGQDLPAYA